MATQADKHILNAIATLMEEVNRLDDQVNNQEELESIPHTTYHLKHVQGNSLTMQRYRI